MLIPIFHAGQIRNQVRLSEAVQRDLLLQYQQAIYGALRDVSDSLIAVDRTKAQRGEEERLVQALSYSPSYSCIGPWEAAGSRV